jgi:ribose-phosphate pyrophosphokinase
MPSEPMRLFAIDGSRAFGGRIAERLGIALAEHEERDFEDGEHKARPLVSVRGTDAYVILSLYGDQRLSVNDKLCRLLFFIGALRDAAAQVTAVIPYLCYARKDRKTKSRDPVTTRYVACLLEAVGTDAVITLDVHNLAAYQNAFRCRTEHLEAIKLFVDHFAALAGESDLAVVSPDVGGIKRAEAFRQALSRRLGRPVVSAFMEKQRSAGVVSGEALVGDVTGKTVIIYDDLVSTGTTVRRAVLACRRVGAERVYAAASHGVFVGDANALLADEGLDGLAVTDTIPPFRLDASLASTKLAVVDAASLFAEAIRRMHSGESIVDLLEV